MTRGRGRPRRSNEWEIRQEVLLGLMGGTPLSVVARRNGVHERTVNRWADCDSDFAEQLSAARALGWDHLAQQCLDIADDRTGDYVTTTNRDGHTVVRFDPENVQRSKLRIDTRLRLLGAWDSARYGLKNEVRVDATVTTVRRAVIDPRSLDDAGRAALKALLLQAAAQGLLPAPDDDDALGEPLAGLGEPIGDDPDDSIEPGGFGGFGRAARQPDEDDT